MRTGNLKGFVLVLALSAFSLAQASRKSLYDVPFNLDWKFATGTQSGMEAKGYNDASWETVSVPHSATYAAPVHSAEQRAIGATVKSDFCYRKKFNCPPEVRKMFIQFGAIMQTATVYVNGTSVGSHSHSGYTAFFFDISSAITRGDTNVVAIRCNAGLDKNIPPGGDGGQMPDFELFSGMYRDAYLICKDSVYVPLWGQRITTTGTAASPAVRAVTTVKNDAIAAKSVTVTLTLLDAAGNSVATATGNANVDAGSSSDVTLTTSAVSSPSLWSPTTPYLYSLRTMVAAGDATVDSVVEKVGLRFYSWSGSGNSTVFSVNGTATKIRGVCLAQFMGWILNAVPNSRFVKQVEMIKAMGMNSIRCSHYPRSRAFYDACDSLGILVLCEVPSWGCGGAFNGNTVFWNHLYSCDTAMVLEAFNHPSIYAWCIFNEASESTLLDEMTVENNIIHQLDPVHESGRVTLAANLAGFNPRYIFDVHALNYEESSSTNSYCLNTEAYGNAMADCDAYGNWFRNYVRGNAMDADLSSSCSESTIEDNTMNVHYWGSGAQMAGSHFWCFMDYSSGRNTTGREGIVDRLWLPKNVYFKMRNTMTGAPPDYWSAGTPTKLELTADNTSLKADGSDISLITAILRDVNNACVHTNCNVTFTAHPASCVRLLYGGHSAALTDSGNPVTVPVEGGRAGVLLRTSRTAGAITVSATASCVSSTPSVTLTGTAPAAESIGPFSWSGSVLRYAPSKTSETPRLRAVQTARGVRISFNEGMGGTVHIYDSQGKMRASYALQKGAAALVDRRSVGSGIVYAVGDYNGRRMLKRFTILQ
jgi:hypothetical protein